MSARRLLAIIELGGYPNFTSLYQELDFDIEICVSMRKALSAIRDHPPDIIVCEFNYQSDFRDRTSSLESMIALVQRRPETQVIVLMEPEHRTQFAKLEERYPFHAALDLPVDDARMRQALESLTR